MIIPGPSVKYLLPPTNKVCEGYVFTGVCLSTLGGHAWFYSAGGMHGFIRGACVVLFGGHVWFYSGVCGFILGVCVVLFGGACMVLFRGACMVFLGGHAWFFQFFRIQWDTVNERVVRILLKCILVVYKFLQIGNVQWYKCRRTSY